MSNASTKRSVVWLDSEKKNWRRPMSPGMSMSSPRSMPATPKSFPPTKSFASPGSMTGNVAAPSPRTVVPSPSPWFDLRSIASDEKSDTDTESIKTEVITNLESESNYTPSEPWQIAAGYEKGGFPLSYYETYPPGSDRGSKRFSMFSKRPTSIKPEDAQIVYPGKIRFILLCICLTLAQFPVSLDRTIVSTAIPRITDDFKSLNDVSWYGSVYLLTATAFQPTFGKIYQIFNVKGTYVAVMSIFMLGSLISAVSESSAVFIFGRAIAGLGVSGAFSGGLTIIAYTVPLEKRAAFTGALGAVFGITMFIGPVLGGVFTDTITWRWCFYINLPITAITVGGIILCLDNPNVLRTKKTFLEKLNELDYIGPLFFLPALTCLFLALQFGGQQFAWNSGTIIGLFFGFGILLPIWIYTQYRLGDKATIPFRVMFQRTVLFSSLFSFCTGAIFMTLAFYIPLYFQAVKGSSATKSGVETLPLIITTTVASFAAGILVTATGYYTPIMIFGMAEFTIGGGLLTTLGVNTSFARTLGYQILAGIGAGMNFQMSIIAVQAVVGLRDIPVATSLTLFFQQLGSAMFLAIAQTVFLNKLLPAMQAIDPIVTKEDIIRAGATGLKDLVTGSELAATLVAYAKSLDAVFVMPLVMGVLSLLFALGIEWKSVKAQKDKVEEGAQV